MEKMLEKNGRRPFKMKKTENSEPEKKLFNSNEVGGHLQ